MSRFLIIVVLIISARADYSTFDPENYREREICASRLTVPLKVDGYLNEDFYRKQCSSDFVQIQPFNGDPASENTDVWIGYDAEAIYVGARMWDSQPDSIVTRVARRDEHFNSDLFEIIIDSYNDKRSGFSFQINPSGAIRDETYFNDSWSDDTWDGIWEGKTRIDDKGWTAEMRIPLSQLRFSEQDEYIWGVIPARFIQRRDEWDYFVYVPRTESGLVSHAAKLTGISGIKPPRRLEYIPYITSGAGNLPTRANNPFYNGRDSNFGVGTDIKIGIGGNLTVDATINPDFGQVEADPSEINLSAYETYYSERRPFFVEGRSIFNFGIGGPTNRWGFNSSEPDFFYSRRIGRTPQGSVEADSDSLDVPAATRILAAAKLSGKLANNWSVGGLLAVTDQEYSEYYAGDKIQSSLIEPLTYYNVMRVQREYQEGRYGLGFMGTMVKRDFKGLSFLGDTDGDLDLEEILNDQALGFGIDGWSFFGADKDWALGGWTGFSKVTGTKARISSLQQNYSHYYQRPDVKHIDLDTNRTALTGFAGRLNLNKENGNFMVNAALGFATPGFETNDLGMTWSTDYINKHVVVGYRWTEPGDFYRHARTDLVFTNNHDFSGVKTSEMMMWMGYLGFNNYWSINWDTGWDFETLKNNSLRGGPRVIEPAGGWFGLGFESDNRKDISFHPAYEFSEDRAGSNSQMTHICSHMKFGHRFALNFGINFTTATNMDQYIDTIEDAANTAMFGNRYVVARLDRKTLSTNLRANYTFSPTLTLQVYFQPYISVGEYSRFKEFTKPESYDFLEYGQDGSTIGINDEDEYLIDPTSGDDSDAFTISNPNFNSKALNGTVVLRWEFSPGSTFYLVWTHSGSNSDNPGNFQLDRDLGDLLTAQADDVLALKVSYWLGR